MCVRACVRVCVRVCVCVCVWVGRIKQCMSVLPTESVVAESVVVIKKLLQLHVSSCGVCVCACVRVVYMYLCYHVSSVTHAAKGE